MRGGVSFLYIDTNNKMPSANKRHIKVQKPSGVRNSPSSELAVENILALMDRLLPKEAEVQATATIFLLERENFDEAMNALQCVLSAIEQVEPERYLGYYTVALIDRLDSGNLKFSSEQIQQLKKAVCEAGEVFLEAANVWHEESKKFVRNKQREKSRAEWIELCEDQEKNLKAIKSVFDYFTQHYQRLSPNEIKTSAETLAIKMVRYISVDFDFGMNALREQVATLKETPELTNFYRDALLETLLLESKKFELRQMQQLERFLLNEEEVEALSKLSQTQKQILLKLAAVVQGHPLATWGEGKQSPSERAVFSRSLKRLENRGLIVRESKGGDKAQIKRTAKVKLTDLGIRIVKQLTFFPKGVVYKAKTEYIRSNILSRLRKRLTTHGKPGMNKKVAPPPLEPLVTS